MIDSTRVTLARQRQGLSVMALADAVGVTARTLSAWESGSAPESRSADLAAATGQPEAFFLRPALQGVADEAAFLRARRRIGARLRHRSLALGTLGMDFYREVASGFRLPALALEAADPRLSPAQVARETRVAWGLGVGALPNLVQLAESRGVRVLGLPVEALEVDAFSFWADDGHPYVFLSRLKTAERSRFDLAHEIGHLVLHGSTTDTREQTDRELEREADVFAAEFLMPESSVRARIPRTPSLRSLLAFKDSFGVSARAAVRAAHDAGRLSEWAYRQVQAELKARGFVDGEPGSQLGHERSRVFQVLADHMRSTGVSARAWALSIGQRPEDVAAFTLGQALMLVEGSPHDREAVSRPMQEKPPGSGSSPELRIVSRDGR